MRDCARRSATQHGAQIEDGFRMLQIAIQLDPDYSDAMAYMNLLYRMQAAICDRQDEYAAHMATADKWVSNAIAAMRRRAQNPRQGQDATFREPPRPPPPPPPGGRDQAARGATRRHPG